MKRCPTCSRIETDDSLVYCRVDGTALVADSGSVNAEAGTSKLSSLGASNEIETSILPHKTDAEVSRATRPATALPESSPAGLSVTRQKRSIIVAVIAIAAIALVVAGYLYISTRSNSTIDSIAVLPFANQSGDAESEYLSDGLTESIINSLSQLSNLKVIPSTSVSRYKAKQIEPLAAANELGVRAILTGRILQRGENLMVSVALVDVRDNKQLWGEQYSRKLADALAVQQEISREISERLRSKLSGEEQKQLTRRDTNSPEAYAFYLKGRHYWNKRTADQIRKAIEQFQQASDKDPNYALAYVGLADCYNVLEEYTGTSGTETVPKAKAFAERAVQLDNSLAEAHTSLAHANAFLWRWQESEEGFKRAIELNPNYPTAHQWYSLLLRDTGRFDKALTECERAYQLDPLSLIIGQNLAQFHIFRGDISTAIEAAKRVIDLDPNYPRGHEVLGWAYLKQGHGSEALEELRKAVDLSSGKDRRALSSLGFAYAISARREYAMRVLKELETKYERHEALGRDVAAVYAGLGNKDEAFAWIEKDFQSRSGMLMRMRWELPFESLRSDARFKDLLKRMGLPE